MIFGFCMMFILGGTLLLVCDWFFPVSTPLQLATIYSMTFPIRLMGIILVIIGVMVLAIRMVPHGLTMFMDLPSERTVPLIHSRVRGKDPDAKFMRGKRVDLEIIRAKNKVFKDAGGGFRIMGHSCRRTYETVGFTLPDWLSAYFQKSKSKYLVRTSDEWRELRKQLSSLNPNKTVTKTIEIDGVPQKISSKMSKEAQLMEIEFLESAMSDPKKKEELLELSWRELKGMEELLFDGIVHNGEEVELFIDSATPNEQDILERQTFINELERHNRYKDPGDFDFGRWVPTIVILLLVGTICAIILQGAFGG